MILSVLLILAAIIFGGAYYAYRLAFFSPTENREKIPSLEGTAYEAYADDLRIMFRKLLDRPYEEVTIISQDGLKLFGRYYHTADGAPLAIGFHGYKSSYLTDFCGGSDLSISQGQNLLLIDQRAHGKSEGRTIAFGIQERRDLLCWINYALHRFGHDTQILLYGVSMGAATVLMASGMDLPGNVKGIIADCPYSRAEDIIVHVGRNMRFPAAFTKPFAWLGARIFGGFDLHETDALRSVEKSRIPILIIHGEEDHFVPTGMSADIQRANTKMVRRFTFPDAGHAMSYLVDKERYWKVVREFMEEVLV